MSHLAETITECLRMCDRMKADGSTPEERQQFIERTIKTCWPFTRPWNYLCANCDDLGLEIRSCDGSSRCGRPKRHLAHSYGVPCHCKEGRKFEKRERAPEDVIAAAARTTKSWSKAGR